VHYLFVFVYVNPKRNLAVVLFESICTKRSCLGWRIQQMAPKSSSSVGEVIKFWWRCLVLVFPSDLGNFPEGFVGLFVVARMNVEKYQPTTYWRSYWRSYWLIGIYHNKSLKYHVSVDHIGISNFCWFCLNVSMCPSLGEVIGSQAIANWSNPGGHSTPDLRAGAWKSCSQASPATILVSSLIF